MEKRAYKRIPVSLGAEVTCGEVLHVAFIRNVSERGLYMITAPIEVTMDYKFRTMSEVKIPLPSGSTLDLYGRVMWKNKISPHGLTWEMGMEIIDPPLQYQEFISTLP